MRNILNVGRDLAVEICQMSKPELLNELFEMRTAEWKYYQISDECGTTGIFNDLHDFEYNSFDLIPAAVEIVLAQEKSELCTTALSLLYQCIEESDTTEMPTELSKKWKYVEDKVKEIGNTDSLLFWESICKWYRVNL